jgi:hypothetical protein
MDDCGVKRVGNHGALSFGGFVDSLSRRGMVRVHRAGEGAPYTGLKPAGWKPPTLITAADESLVTGRADALAAAVSGHVARELHERHARALALRDFAPTDVAAGRRYVEAYVAYTHYLEALYDLLHGDPHGKPAHGGH